MRSAASRSSDASIRSARAGATATVSVGVTSAAGSTEVPASAAGSDGFPVGAAVAGPDVDSASAVTEPGRGVPVGAALVVGPSA
ncbi:hypothetical protein SAMN03159343_0894 [Klenkia marina]|uniref:Uncharacterized protein n=1 Tax=Klenkia marina TaxID=1960309 RepID=A0A1G4XG15_9ACTN|nr:hypothetical protein SAMN03159343_0894 [Klenkia marina]